VSDYLELEKTKIRHKFLFLRNSIEPILALNYCANIFAEIKKLSVYGQAKIVMFYLSCGSEVITDFMVKSAIEDGKVVVVPVIKTFRDDKQMRTIKIASFENVKQSVCGIRQPELNSDDIVKKSDIDLAFIPGIAFDVFGYRMGYGKGYYDRWLNNVPCWKTIGLAYDFQITDRLPIGEYDLPIGMIITEKRIIEVIRN